VLTQGHCRHEQGGQKCITGDSQPLRHAAPHREMQALAIDHKR
jgi:hypothetical protein